MIQNADDANAKKVQFYVDCRSHGTNYLVHSDLAQYQGPALLSVNDAIFSEQDWKGIQSLQQSPKANDPFKVGRFGIGFNSVYHLTGMRLKAQQNELCSYTYMEYCKCHVQQSCGWLFSWLVLA